MKMLFTSHKKLYELIKIPELDVNKLKEMLSKTIMEFKK